MGIMNFVFKKVLGVNDNIELASNSIASLFFSNNSDYLSTFRIRYSSLFNQLINKINNNGIDYYHITFGLFTNNRLPNFTSLVISDLKINAAPKNISINETLNNFGQEVCDYLINKRIPEQYVIGDNSNITYSFVNSYINTFNQGR